MGRSFSEESEIPADLYVGDSYFNWRQFSALSYQLLMVRSVPVRTILEVGVGNGFVADFLRKAGYLVTTFDINPSLNPDIVGNVLELDRHVAEGGHDLVLCAEVLEHMPFEHFESTIDQLARASRRHVYLTIPRAQRILFDIQAVVKLPLLRGFNLDWFLSVPRKEIWEGHHWEVGCEAKCSADAIDAILRRSFAKLDRKRNRWNPYHLHYLLEK